MLIACGSAWRADLRVTRGWCRPVSTQQEALGRTRSPIPYPPPWRRRPRDGHWHASGPLRYCTVDHLAPGRRRTSPSESGDTRRGGCAAVFYYNGRLGARRGASRATRIIELRLPKGSDMKRRAAPFHVGIALARPSDLGSDRDRRVTVTFSSKFCGSSPVTSAAACQCTIRPVQTEHSNLHNENPRVRSSASESLPSRGRLPRAQGFSPLRPLLCLPC